MVSASAEDAACSHARVDPQSLEPLSSNGVDFQAGRTWSNLFNILSGRMSEVGLEKFRLDRDLKNEEADCKRCESHRDYLLQYSPIIRFMRDNINQLGGDINSTNIDCRRCDEKQEGGFDPNYGLRICANWVKTRKHTEDVMAHEMVHAWDHVRFKLDWSDLKHAACTEIRASSLSGECRFGREFFDRRNWAVTQQHQACVKRRAIQSVMGRSNCESKEQAELVVNQVWDSCFADTRPFDEIYR